MAKVVRYVCLIGSPFSSSSFPQDMLPILLAPSPALPLHAANALSGMQLQVSDPRPHEQLTALKYAVRWEVGMSTSDFLNSPVEGERWLVWAAGNVWYSSFTNGRAETFNSQKSRLRLYCWRMPHSSVLESRLRGGQLFGTFPQRTGSKSVAL